MVSVDVDVEPRAPLPRFLRPCHSLQRSSTRAHALFTHRQPFGDAQVIWWPPTRARGRDSTATVPGTVLLFIPGNPGLLDFYVPFLDAIHRGATISASESKSESESLTIFAHAHLGLSSYFTARGDSDSTSSAPASGPGYYYTEPSSVALPAQVQAHAEFLDELLAAYTSDSDSDGGPAPRVLLVGHSIGSWLVMEVLKARAKTLRRMKVGVYMLFPTISHIGRSPSGRKLSPLFRPPWPRTLAFLSQLLPYLVPLSPLRNLLLRLAQPSWPESQLQVVRDLLRAPGAIYAALTMAHDEMERVRELDADFLRACAEAESGWVRVYVYYAREDGWVGEQREVVLRALQGTLAEGHVVLGRVGIPHAFCINHSDEVASQVVEWMRTGGFLGDVRAN